VDFEYSSPNPAAFDIANHFHEWTADYHSPTPWRLQPSVYPSHYERRIFYKAYLQGLAGSQPSEDQLCLLDFQVRAWSPASHAMWGIWGIIQAREELETGEDAEFDYLKYAEGRLTAFSEGVVSVMTGLM
jgi:choline kinase